MILTASDFLWSGPSNIPMMLPHVVVVGSLSNQFCNILDILISFEKLDIFSTSMVLVSTPSKPPISYHFEATGESNLNNTYFSGLDAAKTKKNNHITIFIENDNNNVHIV